ncbi:TPA: hypothetical protein DDZ01_03850 [Candidatus Uhrbacteria bacterium]|nr:hypothetical protein [Candidatus Uhrbacteria bacterium]HCB56262.1 hypothetical protein [Candidatus Uhrbacteria bacterium]
MNTSWGKDTLIKRTRKEFAKKGKFCQRPSSFFLTFLSIYLMIYGTIKLFFFDLIMTKTKVLVLTSVIAQSKVFIFTSLLAISVVVPSFLHSQYITGPLVNAILLIAVVLLGPFEAVMIGIIPSTVALSSGLLPLPLAPMVPFIMISNAIFVALFYYIGVKRFAIGVIIGGLVKFAFLSSTVTLLMKSLLSEGLVAKLAIMMGYPQFITALLGGLIAFFFLRGIKKI